jgi:hypothetical protein
MIETTQRPDWQLAFFVERAQSHPGTELGAHGLTS